MVSPFFGGTFGMKHSVLHKKSVAALRFSLGKIEGAPGEDQSFLLKYIWPIVKTRTLSHDDSISRCQLHDSAECRRFPFGIRNEDENFFVGASFKNEDGVENVVGQYKCQLECFRPE